MEPKKSNPKKLPGLIWVELKKWFPHSGDSLFLFPLFLLLFFICAKNLQGCFGSVLAGMAVTGILVWILKQCIKKERPMGEDGKIYRKYDPFSFPSGHVARAFVITTILFNCNLSVALLILLWALAISVSRIKLKLHFYADVIAGAATGVGVGIFIIWLRFKFNLS